MMLKRNRLEQVLEFVTESRAGKGSTRGHSLNSIITLPYGFLHLLQKTLMTIIYILYTVDYLQDI